MCWTVARRFTAVTATSCGGYLAVAALEARFYHNLLDGLGLTGTVNAAQQMDRTTWAATAALFARVFHKRTATTGPHTSPRATPA